MQIIRKVCGNKYISCEDLPTGRIIKVTDKPEVSEYLVKVAMMQADRYHFAKMFRAKIEEFRQELYGTRVKYLDMMENASNMDEDFFVGEALKEWEALYLGEIAKFTLLLSEVAPKKKPNLDEKIKFEERIAQAKLNDIGKVCFNLGIEVNHNGFIKCPYHNEGTASCKLYPDNHFFSYCCSKSGDNITLVQAVTGKDFNGAIAYLNPKV